MANHLYVNQSKCLIAQEEVEYLGHVISATGMAADSTKIQSMADWPTPTTTIAASLTHLLKKDGFHWSETAEKAFHTLKYTMTQAPVLALPNFTKQFVIKFDASGTGLGAVLMQDGRPIAYYSKALLG